LLNAFDELHKSAVKRNNRRLL